MKLEDHMKPSVKILKQDQAMQGADGTPWRAF
jgi:hypothetical protein